jgi:hypothetical protein
LVVPPSDNLWLSGFFLAENLIPFVFYVQQVDIDRHPHRWHFRKFNRSCEIQGNALLCENIDYRIAVLEANTLP